MREFLTEPYDDGPGCKHVNTCDHALHAGISEACYECTKGSNFKPITDPDFLPEQCLGCGSPVGEPHGEGCPVYLEKMAQHKKHLADVAATIANSKKSVVDQVGGNHYRTSNKKVETWDLYELGMTDDEFRGAMKNNIFKYLDRYRDKNGVQDLKKLQSYGARLEAFETGRRMVALPINIHDAADGKYSAGELVDMLSKAIEDLLTKVKP